MTEPTYTLASGHVVNVGLYWIVTSLLEAGVRMRVVNGALRVGNASAGWPDGLTICRTQAREVGTILDSLRVH